MNTKARVVVALICIALGVGVAIKAVECRFGPPLSGEGLLNVVEVMPQTSPRSIRLRGHINDAISVIKDIATNTADGVMLIKLRYSYAGFPAQLDPGSSTLLSLYRRQSVKSASE